MDQNSTEIDPQELSSEVRESLKQEANLEDDFARNKAKEVRINNMNNGSVNKNSIKQTIKKPIIDNLINLKSSAIFENSAYTNIKELNPKDERIVFDVEGRFSTDKFRLDKDSTELANLVEYKNLDSVSDLDGQKIPYIVEQQLSVNNQRRYYLIPNNLSLIGKFRYKIHNIVLDYQRKTEDSKNLIDNCLIFIMFAWLLSIMSLIVLETPTMFIYSTIIMVIISFIPLSTNIARYIGEYLRVDFYNIPESS